MHLKMFLMLELEACACTSFLVHACTSSLLAWQAFPIHKLCCGTSRAESQHYNASVGRLPTIYSNCIGHMFNMRHTSHFQFILWDVPDIRWRSSIMLDHWWEMVLALAKMRLTSLCNAYRSVEVAMPNSTSYCAF